MKAMFIGAHIDECEYGCAGLTALLTEAGVDSLYLNPATFLHDPPTEEQLAIALEQSNEGAKIVGAKKIMWENRERALFWCSTQEKVLKIQQQIEDFSPDMLFIQYPLDNHPEHVAVAKASYLALSNAACHIKIAEAYAFEAGHLQTAQFFEPHFYVNIDSVIDKVEASLLAFNHGRANGNGLWAEKQVQARYRGLGRGSTYAEVYRFLKFPDGSDDIMLKKILGNRFRWAGNMQYPAFGKEYF